MSRVIEAEVLPANPNSKRTLNWKETKRLQEMKLSPKVERAVREVWEAGPEMKGSSWFWSVLGFFFTPILITVFILSTMQQSIGVRLDNVAITIVWLLFICVSLLVCLMFGGILSSKERKMLLSWLAMTTWGNKTGKWRVIYGRFNTVILLGVLAYCNHIFTAVVYFFVWVVGICLATSVKGRVQHEIDQIERE